MPLKEETTGHFCIFLNATPSAEKKFTFPKTPGEGYVPSQCPWWVGGVTWFTGSAYFLRGSAGYRNRKRFRVLPLRTMTLRHHELGRFEATRTYFLRFRRLNPSSQHHPIRYGPRACLSVQRRSRCVPICWRQQEKRMCSEEG